MAHSAPAAAAAAAAASSADAKGTSDKPLLVKLAVFYSGESAVMFSIFCEECNGLKVCPHAAEWTAGTSYTYESIECPIHKRWVGGSFTAVADSKEVMTHPAIKNVLETLLQDTLRCSDCVSKCTPYGPKPAPLRMRNLKPIGSAATTVARIAAANWKVTAFHAAGKAEDLFTRV